MSRKSGKANNPMNTIPLELAKFHAFGIETVPRDVVARMGGYTNVKSAGFAKAMTPLQRSGQVEMVGSGSYRLSEKAMHDLSDRVSPPTTNAQAKEQLEHILQMAGAAKTAGSSLILTFMYDHGGSHTRQQIGKAGGYGNVKSAGLCKVLSTLLRLGVAVDVSKEIMLADFAFPEGRP